MIRIPSAIAFGIVAFTGTAAVAAEKTVTLAVDNMYCSACPYIVKQTLAKVPGENVGVSFEQKSATVTYDDQKTTLDALISATTQAGFPSRVRQ
jgi:mercuric ion binding protein